MPTAWDRAVEHIRNALTDITTESDTLQRDLAVLQDV